MGLFDRFKKPVPAPAPVAEKAAEPLVIIDPGAPHARKLEVATTGSRRFDPGLAHGSALRRRVTRGSLHQDLLPKRGMWVRNGRSTGILTNLEAGDVATVMVVDADGDNLMELRFNCNELRQCYLDEIPRKRWPPSDLRGTSEDIMELFGYVRESK